MRFIQQIIQLLLEYKRASYDYKVWYLKCKAELEVFVLEKEFELKKINTSIY